MDIHFVILKTILTGVKFYLTYCKHMFVLISQINKKLLNLRFFFFNSMESYSSLHTFNPAI